MNEAKRQFEQQMIQGGVSQYDDWLTLNGIDFASDNKGLLEAAATPTATIGGFNRATFAALEGVPNQFFDIGGSFNSAGLTGLYRTIIKAKARATDDLSGLSVICSEKGMENYKRTIQANERYMVTGTDGKLDATGMNLMINGVPAHVSTFMPNSATLGTGASGTNPATFYILDLNAIYVCWSKVIRDGYFSVSDFEPIGNGYQVRVSEILVRGQLWVEAFSSSAVLVDGETF